MQFQGKRLRHELKYYLHTFDYTALRFKVANALSMDNHSVDTNGYGIRSLYFDGPHNHALYDKNNGTFQREKYRIRIYNGSDERIKLERKSKFGDYICKESVSLNRKQYDDILKGDYESIYQKENSLLIDFYSALAHRGFKPVVIVDYVREAYVYEPGNVRVTFDKRLSAGINSIDLFHQSLVLEEALIASQTVLEIKFDEFLPDQIRKLLQPERHMRAAISKYVICREVGFKHSKD
ncbi:MAG: polyphosphate polymerase domain-containing protein [Melioribacteraceae bacterium]|nr:polyphosphate polymerase domain-containing protein [Melioribacteraceae bacterium]